MDLIAWLRWVLMAAEPSERYLLSVIYIALQTMSFYGHGHAIRPDRSLVHFRKAMEAYENRGRVTSRAQTLGLKSCEFHPQGRYYY